MRDCNRTASSFTLHDEYVWLYFLCIGMGICLVLYLNIGALHLWHKPYAAFKLNVDSGYYMGGMLLSDEDI